GGGTGGTSAVGGTGGSAGRGGTGGSGGTGGTSTGPTPLLYWALDGNGTNTGSVAGYPLVLNGSATYVAGKFGQAAQFNAGAYGLVTGSARAVLGIYAQYTISFWVSATTAPDANGAVLSFENRSTAPYGGIQLYYSSNTTVGMCVA